MRLGGVLRASAEILEETAAGRRPISECLRDWGASHRFAGSGDRAFIGNICYDVLRRQSSLTYRIGCDEPQALVCAAVMANRRSPENLAAELADDKFAPPPLTQAQRDAWAGNNLADAPDFTRADIPEWCATSFAKNFGAGWVAEGAALAQRPPLDLRVNGLKSSKDKAAAKLKPLGAEPASLTPWGLRIAATEGAGRHPNIQAEPAFQKGWIEVQDCGSQMAARLCGAKPQEQILDYCAGGGGKTLALAAEMENRGQIHAYDSERARLAPIFARLKRAGARNAQVHDRTESLEPLAGRMDCVLLDAPCSGAGTWRRHPDTKWKLTAERLAPRLAQQRAVLAAGARYVRPGGRLVYVTCSLLHEEDDTQIERFLAENPGFKLRNMRAAWANALPEEAAAETLPAPHFTPFGLLLSPNLTQTDGFFVSVLERPE